MHFSAYSNPKLTQLIYEVASRSASGVSELHVEFVLLLTALLVRSDCANNDHGRSQSQAGFQGVVTAPR